LINYVSKSSISIDFAKHQVHPGQSVSCPMSDFQRSSGKKASTTSVTRRSCGIRLGKERIGGILRECSSGRSFVTRGIDDSFLNRIAADQRAMNPLGEQVRQGRFPAPGRLATMVRVGIEIAEWNCIFYA
jgi:hypothetical protein